LVAIKTEQRDKCPECHREVITKRETTTIRIEKMTDGSIEEHIDNPYEAEVELEQKCEKCKKARLIRKSLFEVDPKNFKYAICVIDTPRNRFNRLRQDGSFFLRRRWQCRAIVYEVGTDNQKCCLVRPDGSHLLVHKNGIESKKNKPPFVNVNIVLFSRMDYVRQKKGDNKKIDTGTAPDVFPLFDEDNIDSITDDIEDEFDGEEDTTQTKKLLLLKNTGTDCFLITALNVMHNMDKLRDDICGIQAMDQRIGFIRDIFVKKIRNVTSLRRVMPDSFHDRENDAVAALDNLLQVGGEKNFVSRCF
jgi:hypothetical protein